MEMLPVKDPNKVKAGQARQAQLRETLGEARYREHQRALYQAALRTHPDLPALGFQAIEQKLGAEGARAILRQYHVRQRLQRLHYPTPGEAAIRAVLRALGFNVRIVEAIWEYTAWKTNPSSDPLNPSDAIAEGGVGPFFCDIILPVRHTVIEIDGGCHVNRRAYDARRQAFLESQGLNVLVLTEAEALDIAHAGQILKQTLLPVQKIHHSY